MRARKQTKVSANGGPPDAAAVLYTGEVMHARMKPRQHRFAYSVFNLLIDLDGLPEATQQSRMFSVNRFNLVAFHEKDHGPCDGTNLRRYIDQSLAEKGLERPSKILLLAYPRILGYVFNPLSVYYAYDAESRICAVVYEVRNTFGGLHSYVLPVTDGQMTDAGLRQEQAKQFYVSPFINMNQRYHFRLLPPGQAVRVRILETDPDGPLLSATFAGVQRPLSSSVLLSVLRKIPLLTFKVIAAIHWEAFKIWRKRVRFHPRPKAEAAGKPRTGSQANNGARLIQNNADGVET